ncbi:hypothetical protein K2X89_06400 [Myxococcota bacterium]|nr:hypothetical protein [Myxococcota bacterium]
MSIYSVRIVVVVVIIVLGSQIGVPAAWAVQRSMTGSVSVMLPGEVPPFPFEAGPVIFGRKQGAYPPTKGAQAIEVLGTTASTRRGRAVLIGSRQLDVTGRHYRDFPNFPSAANSTYVSSAFHFSATFQNGAGALGVCPGGAGCTAGGLGSQIQWCPPRVPSTLNPAPGTAFAHVGNWDCNDHKAPGVGNRRGRLRIVNSDDAPHFGGTLNLLRNIRRTLWLVRVPPSTPMANDAQVVRMFENHNAVNLTAGRNNFDFNTRLLQAGPIILARLNARGAVEATFGCANGVGDPGRRYAGPPAPNANLDPIVSVGNNCGTNVGLARVFHGWGFRLTTGTISGWDDFPFSIDRTALGTPFNPGRQPQPAAQGFYFTRMGGDEVVGGVRNLVLVGGSIVVDPVSENVFNRVLSVRMRLEAPEPAGGAALAIGLIALVATARAAGRRRGERRA